MTFITLTTPVPDTDGKTIHDGEPFYIRADFVTEILAGDGETIVRTSNGGQYVCRESASAVLQAVSETVPQEPRPMTAPERQALLRDAQLEGNRAELLSLALKLP